MHETGCSEVDDVIRIARDQLQGGQQWGAGVEKESAKRGVQLAFVVVVV